MTLISANIPLTNAHELESVAQWDEMQASAYMRAGLQSTARQLEMIR